MSEDLGLSPQAAVLAFGFGTPAQAIPAPDAPAPTAPAATPSGSPGGPQGTMSAEDAKTMADWTRKDLASGKISSEQADKIFSDLNAPVDQRTTTPDLRDEEQRLIDAQFPVPRPEEYQIRYASPGQPWPEMSTEMKAFDHQRERGDWWAQNFRVSSAIV